MSENAMDSPAPRQLKVDLEDLAQAMDNANHEAGYFLDLETGVIAMVVDDTRRRYDDLVAAVGDVGPAEWGPAFEAALSKHKLPDWEQSAMREADQVERGYGSRFIRVPPADSRAGFGDMEDFIATVQTARLAEQLATALHGRGGFRRFKDVLLGHPPERQRWFAFQAARQHQRAVAWLATAGIEPVPPPPTDARRQSPANQPA